jgi:hypothetical protein
MHWNIPLLLFILCKPVIPSISSRRKGYYRAYYIVLPLLTQNSLPIFFLKQKFPILPPGESTFLKF